MRRHEAKRGLRGTCYDNRGPGLGGEGGEGETCRQVAHEGRAMR
jgi:hypothetical protein